MQKKNSYLTKAIILSLTMGISIGMVVPVKTFASADDFRTPEYYYMGNGGDSSITYSPLDVLNAAAAYDKGYTGSGITVGMWDDGLNAAHREFASKTNTPVRVAVDYQDDASKWDSWFVDNNHGTHVAGIIAAAKDGMGMHGVAYDANVMAYAGYLIDGVSYYPVDEKNYGLIAEKSYWDDPNIKVINNSWGLSITDVADLEYAKTENQYWPQIAEGITDANAKLMLFAAGNDGTFGPTEDSFAYLYAKNARNNIISVGALNDGCTLNSDGTLTAKNDILAQYSCLALGNEEKFVLGTGTAIYSVDAKTTDGYIKKKGTSMATPSVTGVGALVQQAFPYLSGKQIGDVLLSTANKNVVLTNNQQVSVYKNEKKPETINIYLLNGRTLSATELQALVTETLKSYEKPSSELTVRVFSDVSLESLIGQGVVDAGKAVDGLAELNARRLTDNDYSDAYTVQGVQEGQALYTVDTKGTTSEWKNDIKEVRVGKLDGATTNDQDLVARYSYYTTGKYTDYTVNPSANEAITTNYNGEYTLSETGVYATYLQNLMKYYNGDVDELQSAILNKHVGLKKTGEGTLTLSGNNTYEGATIVNEGTLNINGTIAGDAYAENMGTMNINGDNSGYAYARDYGQLYITGNNNGQLLFQEKTKVAVGGINKGSLVGSGTVDGKVTNAGTIGASLPNDKNTVMTINGDLVLKNNSSVQFTGNGDKTGLVAVNGKVTQSGTVNVTVDSSGKYLPGSYSVVKAKGTDVALNVADSNASVYAQGLLAATYSKEKQQLVFAAQDNDHIFTSEQNAAAKGVGQVISDSQNYAQLSEAEKSRLVDFFNTDTKDAAAVTRARAITNNLTSNVNAQASQAVQQSNLMGRMVRARMASVNHAKVSVPVQVTPKSLTTNKAAEQQTITTNITVPVEPENSFWAKVDKGWGTAGSVNIHSTGLTFGYDKQYNDHNRAGVLVSYADSSAGGALKSDKLQDYRVGFYHNNHRGADDVTVYLDYGQQRHDAKRYTYLQSSKNAYDSKVLELGAEYKHDLHAQDGKIFHVAPYVNAQASRYWQDGYDEGLFGQNNAAYNGNYFTTGIGVEVSRYFRLGSYSARLGYKEVWDGASTTMNYNLGSVGFVAKSDLDKHFVTASLGGSAKLNDHGWSLEGDAHIEKGAHDKNYGVSATLKWEW